MKYQIPTVVILAVLISMSCGSSGKVSLDPESRKFYETARLIMTTEEKGIFNHLPDRESRQEFIRDFWAKRDPDSDTEENKFKEDFFSRIEYANLHFREGIPGWKTDRGRIFIYLGPPDKIEQRPFINDPSVKGLVWWGYYRYSIGIEFVDTTGDGSYTINRQMGSSGNLVQVIERAKFGQIFAEGQAKFVDFDVRYNKEKKEIAVSIPAVSLVFKEEEGLLKAEFEFKFFIYQQKGFKIDEFTQVKSFERTEDAIIELEEIVFTFPYDIKPGKYLFDVIIDAKPEIAKARKIIKINVT
ncbi:MAG: GWxTD domain-containing protein [bacterium]